MARALTTSMCLYRLRVAVAVWVMPTFGGTCLALWLTSLGRSKPLLLGVMGYDGGIHDLYRRYGSQFPKFGHNALFYVWMLLVTLAPCVGAACALCLTSRWMQSHRAVKRIALAGGLAVPLALLTMGATAAVAEVFDFWRWLVQPSGVVLLHYGHSISHADPHRAWCVLLAAWLLISTLLTVSIPTDWRLLVTAGFVCWCMAHVLWLAVFFLYPFAQSADDDWDGLYTAAFMNWLAVLYFGWFLLIAPGRAPRAVPRLERIRQYRHDIIHRVRCACGYDLRGTARAEHVTCPECGRVIPDDQYLWLRRQVEGGWL